MIYGLGDFMKELKSKFYPEKQKHIDFRTAILDRSKTGTGLLLKIAKLGGFLAMGQLLMLSRKQSGKYL